MFKQGGDFDHDDGATAGTSGTGASDSSPAEDQGTFRRLDDAFLSSLCAIVEERGRISVEAIRVPPPELVSGNYESAVNQAENYRNIAALRDVEMRAREKDSRSLLSRLSQAWALVGDIRTYQSSLHRRKKSKGTNKD